MHQIKSCLFAIATVNLAIAIGKFFCWSFPLELVTHFQVYYFWLSAILASIAAIYWWQNKIRDRILLGLVLFTMALNSIDILPWYISTDRIASRTPSVLSIMSFNINVENTQVEEIANSIRSVNPDIVVVIEVTPAIMSDLNNRLNQSLPYYFRSPGGGLGIFSKLPLQSPRGEKFVGSDATNLIATIEHHQRSIKIIGTHPLVPVKPDRFLHRNQHLQAIGNYLKSPKDTTILVGDFNLTPWSPYYRQLIRQTGLHNTRLGFGILPTWMRSATHVKYPGWLIPLINIPIDHIFVSKDLKVVRTYVGDSGNSDHAPIVSELVF